MQNKPRITWVKERRGDSHIMGHVGYIVAFAVVCLRVRRDPSPWILTCGLPDARVPVIYYDTASAAKERAEQVLADWLRDNRHAGCNKKEHD